MISNIIIVSDIHAGSQLGLCPKQGIPLDGGGFYSPSPLQLKMYSMWEEFWKWTKRATKEEPYIVVFNGDALDGVHHGDKSQITYNIADQEEIAYRILKPIVDKAYKYYHIRGTEAHSGVCGEHEEQLARRLKAIPDENNNYARYELWLEFGRRNKTRLAHFTHHVGTASRTAYETSAVMSELSEIFTEAGRWGDRVPDIVVRSHRHRNISIRIPTQNGYGIAFTTPAWQLKTPFAFRIAGARITTPQIGGSLIRIGDEDMFDRHKVWSIGRPKTEVVTC